MCYLASGRPVVVQDTCLSDWLPTGQGVLIFHDSDGAIEQIEKVNSDYDIHAEAARRVAEQEFDANKVLSQLLEGVFL